MESGGSSGEIDFFAAIEMLGEELTTFLDTALLPELRMEIEGYVVATGRRVARAFRECIEAINWRMSVLDYGDGEYLTVNVAVTQYKFGLERCVRRCMECGTVRQMDVGYFAIHYWDCFGGNCWSNEGALVSRSSIKREWVKIYPDKFVGITSYYPVSDCSIESFSARYDGKLKVTGSTLQINPQRIAMLCKISRRFGPFAGMLGEVND